MADNFYDFSFKGTTSAAIGIHTLKPDCRGWWISKIQSDTLDVWYAINSDLNLKCHRNVWNASDYFRASCMNWASVFEWQKWFKEGWESVGDDERCGGSKEVNTPKLIGQRVRGRVTMLRFQGSSGRGVYMHTHANRHTSTHINTGTHTHTHTNIYLYICNNENYQGNRNILYHYVFICTCGCMYASLRCINKKHARTTPHHSTHTHIYI